MTTDRHDENRADAAPATMDSDSSAWAASRERWQGPTFAASWISPPSPCRSADDFHAANPLTPHREDDHA